MLILVFQMLTFVHFLPLFTSKKRFRRLLLLFHTKTAGRKSAIDVLRVLHSPEKNF
jgi:hypothetical protein